MKVHFIKNNKTGCGKHRGLGSNRTNSLYIVSVKSFINHFKNNPDDCCKFCVREYNRLNKLARDEKCVAKH